MGMFTSVEGEVRVVASPFCSLALTPGVVEVRKGDLDMVARFVVGIVWDPLYTKPLYLMVAGFSEGDFSRVGVSLMDPTGQYAIVPNGVPSIDLVMDMTDMDIISIPFAVGGYEDPPEA